MFSEYGMERDGYPAEQNCIYGSMVLDKMAREQEGFPVKNSAGHQEESFYGVVASSLKAVVGLDVSLEKLQVVD